MFYSPGSADTSAQELAYARQHFFLPRRYRDPFHTNAVSTESFITYDGYDLLMLETRDALGNRVTVGERDVDPTKPLVRHGHDYRVLQPALMMDPNRNRSTVAFDALGMVAGTAVMGKPEDNPVPGDLLAATFHTDLTQAEIDQFFANPKGTMAATLLDSATTRIIYDLTGYWREPDPQKKPPAFAATLARETHTSDPVPAGGLKIQVSFSYSDGFGREIQKKIQAERGRVPKRDANGKIIVGADGQPEMTANDVSPRWVGSGWTVFNNKGKPVRQYEPFFTDTHRFEFDVHIGVSPVLFYDPVERVVATLHPNHTYEKVVFDPWQQATFDVNDTITLTPSADDDAKGFFLNPDGTPRIPSSEYLPGWQVLRTDPLHAAEFAAHYPDVADRSNETTAATKAAAQVNTPTTAYFDTLGRPFLTVAHNKVVCPNHDLDGTEDKFHTRVELDIEGNQRAVRDAIVQNGDALGRIVIRYDYDMLSNRIHQVSMEAGERWMLNNVAAKPLYAWDSRDHRFRTAYDRLRRPTDSFLREGAGAEVLVGRSVYGEGRPNPEASNLCGKVVQIFDQAGTVTSDKYDFKGNLLRSQRQLAQEYKITLDWSAAVPPEAETYTSRMRYDALNRPIQMITPHSDKAGATVNVIEPIYNEANLLEEVHAWLNQNADPTDWLEPATANLHAVTNIDYNARGQRELIEYGNRTTTFYNYDPLTFRLVQLLTLRNAVAFSDDCPQPPPAGWPGCQVQNLHYTYDPVGNITHIRDDAQQTIYFRNKRVEPSADYTYDAVYRLIEATGREHLGQNGGGKPLPPSAPNYNDRPHVGLPHPGEGNAMGTYLEQYRYDEVGNFVKLLHHGSDPVDPGWTRTYAYEEDSQLEPGEKKSNRLTSTTVGNITEAYSTKGDGYDPHGNMLSMPHLQVMQWDFKDQLCMTQRQKVNNEDEEGIQRQGERTYYVYDATGQRVRKVTELSTGQVKDERIYLGGFEIYRKNGANPIVRETLHIMDDKQRIALVETRTQGNDPAPQQLIRFQFGNHLGSASLELDDQAQIISYEEYTPYGSTAYQAVRNQTETPKRYRYTGKERDEESGLYYHGARYYAPWLGRWMSADPIMLGDGINVFSYVSDNPIRKTDTAGFSGADGGTHSTGLQAQEEPAWEGSSILVKSEHLRSPEVWTDKSMLPLDDFKHMRFTESGYLQIDMNYKSPKDPFKWEMLKSLVGSKEPVVIDEIDWTDKITGEAVERQPGDRITTIQQLKFGLPELGGEGITLLSRSLQRKVFGGLMGPELTPLQLTDGGIAFKFYGTNSASDDVSKIFVLKESIQEKLVGNPGHILAHELFGHFYLATRGAHYEHGNIPRWADPGLYARFRLSTDAGIPLPDGGLYQGSIKDWIDDFAAPSDAKEWIQGILNPSDAGTLVHPPDAGTIRQKRKQHLVPVAPPR